MTRWLVTLLFSATLFGQHNWRDSTVSATGGTAVDDTGHRFATVTITVFDDIGSPWKKWVISKDATMSKTKVDLQQGATFKTYCNGLVDAAGTVRSAWVTIQYRDAKNHKKEEMHSIVGGDACQ